MNVRHGEQLSSTSVLCVLPPLE